LSKGSSGDINPSLGSSHPVQASPGETEESPAPELTAVINTGEAGLCSYQVKWGCLCDLAFLVPPPEHLQKKCFSEASHRDPIHAQEYRTLHVIMVLSGLELAALLGFYFFNCPAFILAEILVKCHLSPHGRRGSFHQVTDAWI
jgi:hypothetical protein